MTPISPIPRAVSGALQLYLAQDGNLYAVNTSDGRAYSIGGGGAAAPAGVPEAPTDSQLYGRENTAWQVVPPAPPPGVAKTGDTMTGTLNISDPGGAGNAILNVNDGTNNRNIRIFASGIIYINAGGSQTVLGSDGSANLFIGSGGGLVLSQGYPAGAKITADTTTGDIIVRAVNGPNAGKSVNLTSGKWA